jgi:hypothetical protein
METDFHPNKENFMQSKVTTIINAGTMTGTSVITSSIIDLSQASLLSLQLVWTGTPNGTAVVQVSNDTTTWSSFTITMPSIAGSAGNGAVQLADCAHQFARVVYTNSSSTGVLTVKASVKEA